MSLLDYVDIQTILNILPIKFKDKGHYYQFTCPYHNDHHPSAALYKQNKYFKCFTCGAHGSILKLMKDLTGKKLSDITSIPELSSKLYTNKDSALQKDFRKKPIILKVHGAPILPQEDTEAFNYLLKRHVTTDFINFFNIQVAHDLYIGPDDLPIKDCIHFNKRILIPMIYQNKIVNYEGRDYTGKQKKVIYPKGGKTDFLFNIENIDLSHLVIVVEGIMDMTVIWSYFTHNVIATLGTGLSPYQINELVKIPQLVMFIDDDEAGHNEVSEIDKWSDKEFEITWIPETDPGDYTRSTPKMIELTKKALKNKMSSQEYLLSKYGYGGTNKQEEDLNKLW